jgi:hypothetical protein
MPARALGAVADCSTAYLCVSFNIVWVVFSTDKFSSRLILGRKEIGILLAMSLDLKRSLIEDELEVFAEEVGLPTDQAFMFWFYHLLFDLDETEEIPDDEIIDGAGERQIDLFRIEVEDAEQHAGVFLIQCKKTKGFSANTVSLMKTALDFIFKASRKDYEALTNQNFRQKISETRELIRSYGNNNVSVSCYFVTLGDERDISSEATQNKDNLMREFGQDGVFRNFDFRFVGVNELDRLVNARRSRKRHIKYDLPILYDANRASVVEFESAGVKSLLCTVKGEDLAKLASTEPRDAVFDANVRGNLGFGGRVNKNIYETSVKLDKAELFWFMNNGITHGV